MGLAVRLDVQHRHAGGVDQRQLGSRQLGPQLQQVPVICLRQLVALDLGVAQHGRPAHCPVKQLVPGGLVAEEPHPMFFADAEGELQRQSRLAIGRVPAQHHHVPRLRKNPLVQDGHAPAEILRLRLAVVPVEEPL